jgi:hypothetical protein
MRVNTQRQSGAFASAGLLAAALAPLRSYSKVTQRLLLDDAIVDLIESRTAIALRIGTQTR